MNKTILYIVIFSWLTVEFAQASDKNEPHYPVPVHDVKHNGTLYDNGSGARLLQRHKGTPADRLSSPSNKKPSSTPTDFSGIPTVPTTTKQARSPHHDNN